MMDEKKTTKSEAFDLLVRTFDLLSAETPDRELALVKTKLEEAMMWLNKHRANVGELKGTSTHVKG